MPEFVESGLVFTLPDGACFRFESLNTYNTLSGQGLREMDFGWWDRNGSLSLLEVFSRGAIGRLGSADGLSSVCISKIVDSILMLSAMWLGTKTGNCMQNEISQSFPVFREPEPVFIYIVLVSSRDQVLSLPMMDIFNNRLYGKTRLFGIGRVSVLNAEQIIREGPNLGIRVRRQ